MVKILMFFLGKIKVISNQKKEEERLYKASPSAHGFTLLELLIVVTLIATFSTFIVPRFTVKKSESLAVLTQIQQKIEKTRQNAAQENEARIIQFLPESSQYKVFPLLSHDENNNVMENEVITENNITGLTDVIIEVDAPLFWRYPFEEGHTLIIQPSGYMPAVNFKYKGMILAYNGSNQPAIWYKEKE